MVVTAECPDKTMSLMSAKGFIVCPDEHIVDPVAAAAAEYITVSGLPLGKPTMIMPSIIMASGLDRLNAMCVSHAIRTRVSI